MCENEQRNTSAYNDYHTHTGIPYAVAALFVVLMLFALAAGYVTGLTVGYSHGMIDGYDAGEQQYQLIYCVRYPFTLLDPGHYMACRKVSK
jgi:hypothetical protein